MAAGKKIRADASRDQCRLSGLLLPLGSGPARQCIVQEVRALAVDAPVVRVVLDALVPDQIEIALAGGGPSGAGEPSARAPVGASRGARPLRGRACPASVPPAEPENRLVARSGVGREAACRRDGRAAACVLARARAACDWPGGTHGATNARREPAADLECGHHVGSRSQAHSAICHPRSRS